MKPTECQTIGAVVFAVFMVTIAILALMTMLPAPLPGYAGKISNFIGYIPAYVLLGMVALGVIGSIILVIGSLMRG